MNLSIVVAEADAVHPRIGALGRGDEELGMLLPFDDGLSAGGGDAVLQPGHLWGRRPLGVGVDTEILIPQSN